MKFKDAIGTNAKTKMVKWINEHIEGKHNKFLVLYGVSGNGKTFLTKLLAKEADMEIFLIEPESVTTEEELNNVLKGINSAFEPRLILIDDYDYFANKFQKKLQEVPKITSFPVVYTSSKWVFDGAFLNGATIIKMKKPLTSELRDFLMKLGADYDIADKLATESKSIRSAILSLQNNVVNDLTRDLQTRSKTLQDLKLRTLEDKLTRVNIKFLFESVRSYNADSLKLMLELAEYDYKIMARFAEIDPYLINNAPINMDNVELKQRIKRNNKKKEVVKMKSPKVVEKKPKSFTSIDSFM